MSYEIRSRTIGSPFGFLNLSPETSIEIWGAYCVKGVQLLKRSNREEQIWDTMYVYSNVTALNFELRKASSWVFNDVDV